MKITSSEHGEKMLCTEIAFDIQNNLCTQLVLPMFCKNKSFWQRFNCTLNYFIPDTTNHLEFRSDKVLNLDILTSSYLQHLFFQNEEWPPSIDQIGLHGTTHRTEIVLTSYTTVNCKGLIIEKSPFQQIFHFGSIKWSFSRSEKIIKDKLFTVLLHYR